MTLWAVITMICVRTCIPTYAEVYYSKEECLAAAPDASSVFGQKNHYCVPVVIKELPKANK